MSASMTPPLPRPLPSAASNLHRHEGLSDPAFRGNSDTLFLRTLGLGRRGSLVPGAPPRSLPWSSLLALLLAHHIQGSPTWTVHARAC